MEKYSVHFQGVLTSFSKIFRTLNHESLISFFGEANNNLFSEKYHSFSRAVHVNNSFLNFKKFEEISVTRDRFGPTICHFIKCNIIWSFI